MVVGKDIWLPSPAELESPEISITTVPLMAAAHQLGKFCDFQCKEFMLCHQESLKDPRKCLTEGKAVTECGLDFLRRVKRNCAVQFERYLNCFEKRSGVFNEPRYCRKDQAPFDDCVREHIGQDRPPTGYFSKIRLHDSARSRFPVSPAPMPQRVEERDLDAIRGVTDYAFAFKPLDSSPEVHQQAKNWLEADKTRDTDRSFVPLAPEE